MSILKKIMYKNTGGTTAPVFSGYDPNASIDQNITNYTNWLANNANQPNYYTGNTIAGFSDDQLDAFNQKRDIAQQTYDLTQDALTRAQNRLDPTSDYNQQIGQSAAASANTAGANAGVLGGLRSQLATQGATQNAVRDAIRNTESDIRGLQGDLTAGADILEDIGKQERTYRQDLINEDIKRWNWTQLNAQQRWDKILNTGLIQEAIKSGRISANPNDANSKGIWDAIKGAIAGGAESVIGNILGNLNQGGYVYKNMGGIIDPMMTFNLGGEVPMDPMMQDQGQIGSEMPLEAPQRPVGDPMMGPGMSGSLGMEMMSGEAPMDPMANPLEAPGMMEDFDLEPMSELDKIEDSVEQLIATTGLPLTVTRKIIKGKTKKKGS